MFREVKFKMKKLLVLLLTISIAFSTLCVTAFAETAGDTGATAVEETKVVESLVGAFYLQGESGAGAMGGGGTFTSTHDYFVADKFAERLTGTDKIPFYAYDKDGSVFFDSYAEKYFYSEMGLAKKAGIDFFAYNLYMGYNAKDKTLIKMNTQLTYHVSKYYLLEDKVNFAVVIDGHFQASKAAERDILIERILTHKGYQTAADGRPVVFIVWNENIADQITRINKDISRLKSTNALDESVEAMYVIALNAPSYAEAIAVGCDAISYTEGSGKNNEAYTSMTAKVEANWANGDKVVPNIVTGFDKTLVAGDKAIEVSALKTSTSKETEVVYARSGAADDVVAKATPAELVEHAKKAIATTNKPEDFKAVMFYAWDDFLGGAFLCPTKTDKAFQYDTSYVTALREYFYGKTSGMAALTVLDNEGFYVTTEENGTVTKTNVKGEVVTKVDKDGNNLLTSENNGGDEIPGAIQGDDFTLYIIIGAAAVVVIAVVVIVIVVAGKKKKAAKSE